MLSNLDLTFEATQHHKHHGLFLCSRLRLLKDMKYVSRNAFWRCAYFKRKRCCCVYVLAINLVRKLSIINLNNKYKYLLILRNIQLLLSREI